MGCGASKPATAGEAQAPQAQPAAAPNSAAKPPLPKQNASAGSKNESRTTDTNQPSSRSALHSRAFFSTDASIPQAVILDG